MPRRERVKDMQQRHRIQPAGNRHQNRLAAFQQAPALDILFDALEQIGHALMLLHGGLKQDCGNQGGALIWVVVSALCADSFEPQARRYNK